MVLNYKANGVYFRQWTLAVAVVLGLVAAAGDALRFECTQADGGAGPAMGGGDNSETPSPDVPPGGAVPSEDGTVQPPVEPKAVPPPGCPFRDTPLERIV